MWKLPCTAGNLKAHITSKSCDEIQCNLCDKTLKSAGYLEKHISSVHRVQMKVVKTIEGHIGLFNWAPKDLHCSLRDKATCAAKFPAWETLCHFLPERMRSHIGCIYLTFLCCVYLMCPKVALWRGCKVTSVAFVWFFSTVCFQMCPQIARLRGCIVALVACVLMWILKLPT